MMIAAMLLSFGQGIEAVEKVFTYRSSKVLNSVSLAGSFNGWNKDAQRMSVQADGKTWSTKVRLPYGKHTYKFVLNGSDWVTDPSALAQIDDGAGNTNSLVFVLPSDYVGRASGKDGVSALSAVRHSQEVPMVNLDRGMLTLGIRVRPDDFASVSVVVDGKRIPAEEQTRGDVFSMFAAQIPWDGKRNLSYRFELVDGSKTLTVGKNGVRENAEPFTIGSSYKRFETPAWVEGTVFYQIFPDRFENGDRTNDPKDVMAWGSQPTWFNRFGGDIAGVAKRAGYLKELGISGIYFNPIFKSPSNHRYDAEDFKALASDFGTIPEFTRLTKQLDSAGIKTVMDFVFNHTATSFPAFADVVKNGEKSTKRDWYFVRSFPVKTTGAPNYEGWNGFGAMPKLNVLNPEVQAYFKDVVRFWNTNSQVAGMRLDVAGEVEPAFWQMMRPFIKGLKKDMWIVGEVWGDGSPWLKGDQWDSVMNYQFRNACLGFIAQDRTTSTEFASQLMSVHKSYASQVSRNMMNLLSSHDTPRFITECKGDQAKALLGAVVQMTWVGAPSIYYGEEIGMEGGQDPDNRRCMDWAKAQSGNTMLSTYRRLISVRNSSKALQSGDVRIAMTQDQQNSLAYTRTFGEDFALITLTRSSRPLTVSLRLSDSEFKALKGKSLVDQLSGNRYLVTRPDLSISLSPKSARVLTLETRSTHNARRSAKAARRMSFRSKSPFDSRAQWSNT